MYKLLTDQDRTTHLVITIGYIYSHLTKRFGTEYANLVRENLIIAAIHQCQIMLPFAVFICLLSD